MSERSDKGGTEFERLRQAAALDAEILAFIAAGAGDFEGLALRLFAHQFRFNPIYGAFCRRRGKTPDNVRDWKAIPAVPTTAFKYAEIAAFPLERTVEVFHTSGTTQAESGRHYFETTALYDSALRAHLAKMMGPRGARVEMLSLTSAPAEAPHSSLTHMIDVIMGEWALPRSERYFTRNGQTDYALFHKQLREAAARGGPVYVFGTAFAWVGYIDSRPAPVALPAGSCIMETGGFKGRSREVGRDELYRELAALLGIGEDRIVAEYGMTELSSQYYDDELVRDASERRSGRIKVPPPWMRPLVVDPSTLEELPAGEVGLLRHVDLANRGSCIAIQTEDLGRIVPGGIELLGRAPAAEPRGCSLAVEELLAAGRSP